MSEPRPDWRDGVPVCTEACPHYPRSCTWYGLDQICVPQIRELVRVLLPLADVAAAEGEREVRAAREVALEIRDHGAGGER